MPAKRVNDPHHKDQAIRQKYPHARIDGIRIIQTDLPEAPFCFLNRIYWRSDLPMHTADGRLILQHELTHIRQRHTYDKLAAQVMTCILWMNPFYWLIQKELALIHEFIADEKSIKHDQGITEADYSKTLARMLLQAHNQGHYFQPGQHFFSSSLKRRFIMLQTNNRVRVAALRCAAILPVIAVSIFIFGMKSPDTSGEPVIKAAHKIVLVIDPGHGGTDKGCSTTSLTEKELTLKLALRMVQLAPEYNIDVRLTRNTDAFVSLQDRTVFANSLHPDGLLSLHIDSAPKEALGKGKFDIIVNSKSHYPEKSKQLATSIYKHLYRPDCEQRKEPSDRSLYILKKNFSPAVLIELGNIHNAAQMEYFSDDKKLDIIAGQILQGVVEAYQ